jgi:hypothetical protein
MWAVIDKQTQIVVGAIMPDAKIEDVKNAENDFDIVEMTLENSPASIGDKYEEGKFKKVEN